MEPYILPLIVFGLMLIALLSGMADEADYNALEKMCEEDDKYYEQLDKEHDECEVDNDTSLSN